MSLTAHLLRLCHSDHNIGSEVIWVTLINKLYPVLHVYITRTHTSNPGTRLIDIHGQRLCQHCSLQAQGKDV